MDKLTFVALTYAGALAMRLHPKNTDHRDGDDNLKDAQAYARHAALTAHRDWRTLQTIAGDDFHIDDWRDE